MFLRHLNQFRFTQNAPCTYAESPVSASHKQSRKGCYSYGDKRGICRIVPTGTLSGSLIKELYRTMYIHKSLFP